MEREKKSILIIDSCPLICEAYKSIINSINKRDNTSFEIISTYCGEEAANIISLIIIIIR